MSINLQTGVITPDGKFFSTKAEAIAYLRKPLIHEALMKITGKNKELSDWLAEKQEEISSLEEVGVVQRVTKSERKQLEKALEAIKAVNEKAFAFVADNADAIVSSFRWPSVKRMDDSEKAAARAEALKAITEGNDDLAKFVNSNMEAIMAAYEAGVEKRTVPQSTLDKLAEARAKRAAEKAQKAA